jgi:hypothetical protein
MKRFLDSIIFVCLLITMVITVSCGGSGSKGTSSGGSDGGSGGSGGSSGGGTGGSGGGSGTVGLTAVGMSGDPSTWPLVPVQILGKPILQLSWGFLEPSQGSYNWKDSDEWVAQCQSHSVPCIFSFGGVPKWAAAPGVNCGQFTCAGPPENQQDLTDFASAVAARYAGKIAIYELWNEPQAPDQFNGTEPQLVAMTKAIYAAVQQQDPAAEFSTPGWATDANETLQINAITNYFNYGGGFEHYLSFHWYPRILTDCSTSTIMSCVQTNLPADIAAVKQVGNGRPILLTESSWGQDAYIPASEQPAFATAWVNAVQSAHIVGIWWAWQKAGQASDTEGTLWNGTSLNPAGQAFAAAIIPQTMQDTSSHGVTEKQ